MKKATLLITCLFSMGALMAQQSKHKNIPDSGSITCSQMGVTKPLRELFPVEAPEKKYRKRGEEQEDREHNIPQKFLKTVEKDGPAYGNDDATMQKEPGTIQGHAPIQNFAGQSAAGFYPLDPSGAVGPNHYIQMINSTTFKVYNKSTGAVMLTGTLGNLWAPVTPNDGDPIALYDKAANRWFMSQFGQSGNKIYIAISQTADPLGSWYTYTFTSPSFPDYLKFSVWQDGYYMTSNQAQKVFAFERTKMLLGQTARSVYHTFSPPNAGYFFVPLAGDSGDGTLAPAGTPCPVFSYSDNGWGSGYTDAINIFKCTTNWVPTTATMTIASAGSVPCTAFDASYNASWNDISQPGTTQKLDGIGGTLMFRAQWKPWNGAGYNSVVLSWGVKISTTQRSIKWCELHQDQTTGVWTMFQQGIYTPDTNNRWMGSIAMDDYGSIGLCYMKDNATNIYPSLYYTGRRTCDPLGTLPVTEELAKAGTASQVGVNRDGDYSQTTLDPDGVTFWHTGMYMGAGGAQKTQIYSFQITPCTVTNPPVAAFTTINTTVCANVPVTFNDQSTNFPTSWAWSFPGGTPASSTSQNPTVTYTNPGTYNVSLTATNGVGSGSNTLSNYITVNATPSTPVASVNSPLCSGAANIINLTTPAVAGVTYSWTGPVSFTSALQNATRPATSLSFGGNYILTETLNGCTSQPDTVVVVINATPGTPVITANTPVCVGNTLTMTVPTVSGATYSWTGPNSFTSGTQNQSIPNATTAMAGTYSVTVTSALGCTSLVGTKVVAVNTLPPTPTITQNWNVLTSSSAVGNQWYLNGILIPGATSQTYTMTQNGVYTVIATVSTCPSAVSAAMNVTNLGIAELTEGGTLVISPNPNQGVFSISFIASSKKNYKLKLFNELGQVVYEKQLTNVSGEFKQNIDVSTYGKGVYMFTLSDDKNQTVKQIIVE